MLQKAKNSRFARLVTGKHPLGGCSPLRANVRVAFTAVTVSSHSANRPEHGIDQGLQRRPTEDFPKPPRGGFFFVHGVLLRCWPNEARKPDPCAGLQRFLGARNRLGAVSRLFDLPYPERSLKAQPGGLQTGDEIDGLSSHRRPGADVPEHRFGARKRRPCVLTLDLNSRWRPSNY